VARIRVDYFAILREHAGRASEQVETEAGTVAELYRELDQRYRFPHLATLKVAVNDEFRNWDCALADGDTIVFIPPVAGG
jgi:molybdopterin converting factor subunit 1